MEKIRKLSWDLGLCTKIQLGWYNIAGLPVTKLNKDIELESSGKIKYTIYYIEENGKFQREGEVMIMTDS